MSYIYCFSNTFLTETPKLIKFIRVFFLATSLINLGYLYTNIMAYTYVLNESWDVYDKFYSIFLLIIIGPIWMVWGVAQKSVFKQINYDAFRSASKSNDDFIEEMKSKPWKWDAWP